MRQSSGALEVIQYYTPWRFVPATYIICERDNSLSVEAQRYMASQDGGKWRIASLETGHSPLLVCPDKVAEILVRVTEEDTVF